MGDLVYLKLQPHIQSSVASRSNYKLSFRFYGPFKVLQRVGAVAYKLEFPPSSFIHLVVHVSQLKRHISSTAEVSKDLSSVATDPLHIVQLVYVLDRAWFIRGNSTAARAFIQWSGSTSSSPTWEDKINLRRCYPQAPAWGHAGS